MWLERGRLERGLDGLNVGTVAAGANAPAPGTINVRATRNATHRLGNNYLPLFAR